MGAWGTGFWSDDYTMDLEGKGTVLLSSNYIHNRRDRNDEKIRKH